MEKIYIKNLILASLIFLLLCSIFLVLYLKINSNFNKITESVSLYQEKEQKKEEIKNLNKIASEIKDDMVLLDSHFVLSSEISFFFEEVEKMALSQGAKAQVLSVKAPDLKNENAFVEVNVVGNFLSLYKFLLLLENSKYELKIVSANFSKEYNQANLKPEELPSWTANFVIKIISFIEN